MAVDVAGCGCRARTIVRCNFRNNRPAERNFSIGLTVDPNDKRGVVIRPLDSDVRDSFEKLLAMAWQQTWSGELARRLVQWRYHDRPAGHITWVACVGGECVAMLDSRVRPYLLLHERRMVRETADWFCMPQYRQFGLGLLVLRKLRNEPEPVLVVGGSQMTRQILPRLGWSALAPVRSYVLPVTARGLAANMLRRRRPHREALARIVWGRLPGRAPRYLPPPPGRPEVHLLAPDRWQDLPADPTTELVGLLEQDHWRWLAAMPAEFARPLAVLFRLNGVIVGCCLAQLEPTVTGLDGRLVHVQACRHDAVLLRWIMSTTVRILAERGAEFIRCFVSTPEKEAAVEAAGFVFSQDMPCFWWDRPGERVPQSVDIDYLRGDDAQPLAALPGRFVRGRRRPAQADARSDGDASSAEDASARSA
mgnify:CR=1 FL=1